MGRKTFDSLGRCLPNRYNVVLSKQFDLFSDTATCVLRPGITESLVAEAIAPSEYKEAFVIGGATIYRQFHHIVERYFITIVNKSVENGDAFFDLGLLEQPENWSVNRIATRQQGEEDDASYEIFEVNATNIEQRREHRKKLVAEILAKRKVLRQRGPRPSVLPLAFPKTPVFDGM